MKKIKFQPISKKFEKILDPPTPAIKKIPSWYKNMSNRTYPNINQTTLVDGAVNSSMKMCSPVFDSMTAGYTINLPCDVEFVPEENNFYRVMWRTSWEVVSSHDKNQVRGMPISSEYEEAPLKWMVPWKISTPRGYSAFFTHPLYRQDLPFYSLPGIVDTDFYDAVVHIPFFIKKDFFGIIPMGTPIAQVIPIKRDIWNSEVVPWNESVNFNGEKVLLKITKSYKKFWRQKKIYR